MGVYNLTGDTDTNETVKKPETEQGNTKNSLKFLTVTDTNEQVKDGKDGKDNIVLDGPLGRIYTEALLKAYAKEDMAADLPNIFNPEDQIPEDDRNLYVYCVDGSSLNTGDISEGVNKLSIALDSKKYKGCSVIVECSSVVSDKINLLTDYTKAAGIKTYITRKTALEAFKCALEGFKD